MRVPPLSEWLIEFEPSKITIGVGKNIPTLPSFLSGIGKDATGLM